MYKVIKDMPHMGIRSVVLVAALLGGCSDLVTRFDYNKNAAPAYKTERTDVKSTASIAPAPKHQTTAPAPASPYTAVQPNFKNPYKPVRVPLFKSNNTLPQTRPTVHTTAKQPLRSEKAITFAEYHAMKHGKQGPTAKTIPWASWTKPSKASRSNAPLHTASVIKPTAFNEDKGPAITRVIKPIKLEVKEGQTLYSLARQHNSSVDAIIQANNLDSANIFIGQSLLIPTTSKNPQKQVIQAAAKTAITNVKADQPIAATKLHSQEARSGQHIVVKSDTLESLAKDYNVSWTKLAALNAMEPNDELKAGTVIKLPHQSPQASIAAKPAIKKAAIQKSTVNASVSPQDKRSKEEHIFTQSITVKRIDKSATTLTKNQSIMPKNFAQMPQKRKPFRADVTTTASIVTPQLHLPKARTTPQKIALPKETQTLTNANLNNDTLVKPEQSISSKARISEFGFRWPVQGRIIRSFGAFPGGKFNEGINIAVPEGTNIHAAEGGKVAYAGNEHKQYGQLIVIYHADNWVTVYAHNKSLNVQEGDQVKRGQIIAEAGATGNVDAPQLHFQIRKSAKAYNPLANLPKS